MKTCGYCGNEYDDKEPKCPVCGATLLKHAKGTESATAEYSRLKDEIARKRKNRSVIIGVGAGAIVLAVIIGIFSIVSFINDPQRAIAKEAQELLSQAEQQMNAGQYEDALETLNRIDTAWDDYSSIENMRLEAVKGQLKAKLAEYEAAGNYQAIISMIDENVADIYADTEVKSVYENAVQGYKDGVLADAETYVASGDYVGARSILSVAENFIGPDVEISEKLKEINEKEVLEVVLAYEAEENYGDAITYLNRMSAIVSGSAELQAKQCTYIEMYRTNVIKEASSAYKEMGYESALSILSSAMEILPDDAELINEKAKYHAAAPIRLVDLDCTQKGESVVAGAVGSYASNYDKDVSGNTYAADSVIYIRRSGFPPQDEETDITYFLNAEYDVLTGTLYRPYITLSCKSQWDSDGVLKVYGDGVLLYTGKITQKTYDTISLNIDVSGVRELTLDFDGYWYERGSIDNYYPKCSVADLHVAKEP